MILDRDTRRSPRTRVLAVIKRRSAHCSLLRTHKPGSPLLPCLGRTPMPLAPVPQPILDCSLNWPPKSTNPYPESPDPEFLGPGKSFSDTQPVVMLAVLFAPRPVPQLAWPLRTARTFQATALATSLLLCGDGTRAVLSRHAAGVLTGRNMGKEADYRLLRLGTVCTTFLCTCLILGLGPQTKTPHVTTHHGLVTSHCITLILRGQNHHAAR